MRIRAGSESLKEKVSIARVGNMTALQMESIEMAECARPFAIDHQAFS